MASELLPVPDGVDIDDLEGTFLAVDFLDGRQLVGTLRSVVHDPKDGGEAYLILELPNQALVREPTRAVLALFIAPMGYRASARARPTME